MPKAARPRVCSYEKKSDAHRQGCRRSLTTCALASFSKLPGSLQVTRHVRKKKDKQGTPLDHMSRRAITLLRKEGSCAIHTRYCFGRSYTLHHHKSVRCRQISSLLQTRKLKLRTQRNITRMVQSVNGLRRQTRSF